MNLQQHLHSLRLNFIELNIRYTREMRDGKQICELSEIRADLIALEEQIMNLKQKLIGNTEEENDN